MFFERFISDGSSSTTDSDTILRVSVKTALYMPLVSCLAGSKLPSFHSQIRQCQSQNHQGVIYSIITVGEKMAANKNDTESIPLY